MNDELFQHYKIRLTPITPTVISDGEKITQAEYYTNNNKVVVVDFDKYMTDNPDKLQIFLEKMGSAQTKKFSLNRDMPEIKGGKNDYIKYSLPLMGRVSREINSFVKMVSGRKKRPYIPGSSVKGAIRTALAYRKLKYDHRKKDILMENIPLDRKIKKNEHFVDWLLFRPQNEHKKDIHYDLLRLLEVVDSRTFEPNELLGVYEVHIFSGAENKKTFNLFSAEAWKPHKTVEMELKLADSEFLDRILTRIGLQQEKKVFDWKYITEALNEFAVAQLKYDIQVLDKLPEKSDELYGLLRWDKEMISLIEKSSGNIAYFSIGQGQGWHRITDGMLIESEQDIFKLFLDKNFSRGKKKARPPFPKSRRVVKHNGEIVPLGWVKMEIVEGEEVVLDDKLPEIEVTNRNEPLAQQKNIEVKPPEPEFKVLSPEKEPQSTNRNPKNKLKMFRFPERILDELLRKIVMETMEDIAALGWVKNIIADFSKSNVDSRLKTSDIRLRDDIRQIEAIISDGKCGVSVIVETYATTEEERNYAANRIWEIIKRRN
ncbi:type III-A CRISPR-associated RAMP protein Csm5 [bacterium]|nr:type III-A CRISPR-associated RAMP protein Csm5 [bacterium]